MKKSNKIIQAASLRALLTTAGFPAMAAGGHYAVDDAAILESGQCQLEVWFEAEVESARRLLHVGPACRVGPVELGLNVDRARAGDASKNSVLGPQVKWASALNEQLSIGLAAAANWQNHTPRYLGSSLIVPISYQVSQAWLAHVNIGRDFLSGAANSSRAGMALEWAPNSTWTFIGERFRDSGTDHWRLGGRWTLNEALSLDLSRAQGMGNTSSFWWTLGLNLAFNR